MKLRSPLSRVKGLGSAKDGTHHWWHQRLTAVALVPLSLWFLYAMTCLGTAGHEAVLAWMRQTHVATLLIAFVIALFYHAQLGLQVVIEDYIGKECLKIGAIVLVKFIAIIAVLVSILCVLNIYLGFGAS